MLFNVTFNNIAVRSWWSVLLVEETENHRPGASLNETESESSEPTIVIDWIKTNIKSYTLVI